MTLYYENYSISITIEQFDCIFRCFHSAVTNLIFYEKFSNDLLIFSQFLRSFKRRSHFLSIFGLKSKFGE